MEGDRLMIPPVLLFEILSPSTARKDRVLKYQLYENAGAKYYCIVDPENRSAEVFVLGNRKYNALGDLQGGKVTFDLGPCIIVFDFEKLFAGD
jgi:Uma2 family endonuclease